MRKTSDTKSRIVSSAWKLFYEQGYDNTTIDDIVEASNSSKGSFYHYFKSKDELAIQVTDHVDAAYAELEPEYLADTTHSAREKLLDFIGQSLTISVADPVVYKAFIHALKYPEQGVLKLGEHRVYYRLLRELVELCKHEGSIGSAYDTEAVVEQLVTIHRGMLLEWRIYESNFDIAARGRALGEVYLRGLKTL